MNNLYKPSYLKQLCEQYALRPSKKYGQNYLISSKPIEAMLEAGNVTPHDTVVEVGPGFGVLTLPLAQHAKQVIAFEIEKKLKPYWEEQTAAFSNIYIVWGNVLDQFSRQLVGSKPYKVIANLPYQITSLVLRTFLEQDNPPTCMVVMVQKEVAERMCATAGTMSLLSVSVQYFGTPKIITKVSKGNFFPSPKVDSAVVGIFNITPQKDTKEFFSIVKLAFSNKRKQAWKNISTGLGIDGEVVKKVISQHTGNPLIRAQEISVEQWRLICFDLSKHIH